MLDRSNSGIGVRVDRETVHSKVFVERGMLSPERHPSGSIDKSKSQNGNQS
jgi:hypothetical protein